MVQFLMRTRSYDEYVSSYSKIQRLQRLDLRLTSKEQDFHLCANGIQLFCMKYALGISTSELLQFVFTNRAKVCVIIWVFETFPEYIMFIKWWIAMALRWEIYRDTPDKFI